MNIINMTHAHPWPLELQLPPAHPPATHKMASTLSSPSNWDTSDVTCTKRKMTLKIFLSRKKDGYVTQLLGWCRTGNGIFNRNLNTQICCYWQCNHTKVTNYSNESIFSINCIHDTKLKQQGFHIYMREIQSNYFKTCINTPPPQTLFPQRDLNASYVANIISLI